MNRYNLRKIRQTNDSQYQPYLETKKLKSITHYGTADLNYPDAKQISQLQTISKIWSFGDSFWKLSQEHYGDFRYWWIIAWFNQKPTECDVQLGEVIRIPLPLNKIIGMLKV